MRNKITTRPSTCLQLLASPCLALALHAQDEAPPVFEPQPDFYQVVSGQANRLNPRSGGYTPLGVKTESYNAAGYNPLDGYVYAWGRYAPYKDKLIRIHGDGSYRIIGTPVPNADASPETGYYAADMDHDGNLWVRSNKLDSGSALIRINVETNRYDIIRFSGASAGGVADLVYLKIDGRPYFFGARHQRLFIWDVEARTVSRVNVANLPEGRTTYGAAYTDKDGSLFVSSNKGGVYQILNFTKYNPRAVYLLDSAVTNNNDGWSIPEQASPIIVPENQPPAITLGDSATTDLPGASVNIALTITDEGLPLEGDGLTIQWTQESGPGEAKFSRNHRATTDVTFTKNGDYVIRATADDGEYQVSEDFNVTVTNDDVSKITTYAVSEDAYRQARQLWAQVKEQLHCRNEGTPLETEKLGFNPEDFHLQEDSEVLVTLIYDGGTNRNTLGWHDASNPDLKTTIWQDASTGPNLPLRQGARASLGVLPAGTDLRFHLIQDGARGGSLMLYQDAYLNPGSMEHVAARLFTGVTEDRPLILAFEDWELGYTDLDYNDVIFQIEFRPVSLGTTQYDNVIPGISGIHSNREARGVERHLRNLGIARASFEHVGQLYQLPNHPIQVTMIEDRSSMKFDLCVYDHGKLDHLDPSSLEYRKKAAESAISIMDDRLCNIGSVTTMDPVALGLSGKTVGFFIVPNNTRSTFLRNPWRYTPKGQGERTKRQPLFTLNGANAGNRDQFLSFVGNSGTVFAIEDHSRYEDEALPEDGAVSDNTFDDIIIHFDTVLETTGGFHEDYRIGSPDPTTGFIEDDGHLPREDDVECCY
ncbi:DUF4114 domain-containing protein [Haloferula rosea]|uniref:DUF4114 domain-containing protein n=1 Tax=Haloferula rosea TaxID=490093 RepID=A0A934VFA7_9BACT|nr:DUF4114 domain-containing protein [Haloferula rosea]MBK1828169.1 DUF4114 domain-containing protein [Haloferula rosea]